MQAVQTAMDRKDRERELVSAVLSSLHPKAIPADQMAKGFTRLLQFAEVGFPNQLLAHAAGTCWCRVQGHF